MRTTDVYDVKRTGDLGGDRVAMKIDSNSIAHLMSVLTDLYSDPVMAVIREYSTNARDSHVEAGVTRPIEITLPSGMNPYFKVRDYGVGLSVDDITNIYSQYGASTKRDTDEQTGMLGLGCKSALTYTSQFTVVGVKNGVKATVLVSRVEDGTGVMEIIDTVATNEHNGVEISVPVKVAGEFQAKTMHFFSFWDEGTVLVNGQAPARIKLNMVTDKTGISTGGNLTADYVVMGGVAYPCANRLYDGNRPYNDNFRVVSFVEIGDVHFVPSREALSFTKRTETKVQAIKDEFTANLLKTAQAEINQKVTHSEAYECFAGWQQRLGAGITKPLTYKGTPFPESFTFKGTVYNSGYSRYQVQNQNNVRYGTADIIKAIHISGYDGVQINSRYKEKIREWKAQNGIQGRVHILTVNEECGPWVPASHRVTWAEIKAISLGTGAKGGPRGPIKLSVFDPSIGYFTEKTDLDKTKVPVYLSPKARLSAAEAGRIVAAHPGVEIVSLGENRWEKFKRDYPNAKHVTAFVKDEVAIAKGMLSKKDLQILGMDRWEKERIKKLDASRIDDPAVKDAIAVANGQVQSSTIDRYNACVLASRAAGVYADDINVPSALAEYPLLENMPRGTMEHAYIYLNAVYAARQAGTI